MGERTFFIFAICTLRITRAIWPGTGKSTTIDARPTNALRPYSSATAR